MARIQEESEIKTVLIDQVPMKLSKVGWNLLLWPKFWEHMKTYLSQCRGMACIPLHYLVQDHDAVTQEQHNMALYDSVDNYLIAINNSRLYNKLKPLVVEGAGWAFIKKFDCSKNGRGALLALKKQAEGKSAKQTRKAKAYTNLVQARYHGKSQNFELSCFVQIHQDAHSILLELEEPVPETKKVQGFLLSGILDSCLQVGKDKVLGTAIYLQDQSHIRISPSTNQKTSP
jgi:hypothetical protein